MRYWVCAPVKLNTAGRYANERTAMTDPNFVPEEAPPPQPPRPSAHTPRVRLFPPLPKCSNILTISPGGLTISTATAATTAATTAPATAATAQELQPCASLSGSYRYQTESASDNCAA